MAIADCFAVFKPAPHLPEIDDSKRVNREYKYWRIRIFYSMYVGYLFYYFSRKSLSFITTYLITDLSLTKSDIGLFATILSFSYGISRFLSGILSDRSNPRYFMSIGLILTGICNIIFGCSSSLLMLGLFWGLNGWFQGWGWPSCAKQLTHWFSKTERGTWWSACTTSHTVGGFLIAYIAAYGAVWFGWRWAMFIPGVICIIAGFWLLERQRDVPQSLGLPAIEVFKNEPLEKSKKDGDANISVKEMLLKHILGNPYLWVLGWAYFFICIVRMAVNDWGMLYLVEMKQFDPKLAAICVSWFEIGGFFGMLVAGFTSDRVFEGRRVPVVVLASLGSIASVAWLWYLGVNQFFTGCFIMAVIGFFVFGPQMLLGLAASEFVSKKAASTANGFAGGFAYLGAAVSGYPLLKITELYGWYWFIVALVLCSAVTALVLVPILLGKRTQDETPVEEHLFQNAQVQEN